MAQSHGQRTRQLIELIDVLPTLVELAQLSLPTNQVILPPAPAVSNEGRSSPLLGLVPPFLGPGFRLGARWNRLGQAVKMRKKREKTGGKWARYSLRSAKEGS